MCWDGPIPERELLLEDGPLVALRETLSGGLGFGEHDTGIEIKRTRPSKLNVDCCMVVTFSMMKSVKAPWLLCLFAVIVKNGRQVDGLGYLKFGCWFGNRIGHLPIGIVWSTFAGRNEKSRLEHTV